MRSADAANTSRACLVSSHSQGSPLISLWRLFVYLSAQMNSIMEECEASTDILQNQVDEVREKSQRELAELRRQLQEKGAELEKSQQTAKKLQEEVRYSLSVIHQYVGSTVLVTKSIKRQKQGEKALFQNC